MSEPTGVPAMYPGRPVSMRTGRGANQSDRQATECENGNKDGRWHCLLSTLDEQPRQRGRRKVVPRQLGKARTAGCRHGLKWRSSQTQPQSSQRAHLSSMVVQECQQGSGHLALIGAALPQLAGDLLGHIPRPNASISPIPIRISIPVIAAHRQTRPWTLSDWKLIELRSIRTLRRALITGWQW